MTILQQALGVLFIFLFVLGGALGLQALYCRMWNIGPADPKPEDNTDMWGNPKDDGVRGVFCISHSWSKIEGVTKCTTCGKKAR
jgi:hypothetical protein